MSDKMVVITLTDCPPKVRGDLSKWLIEVNTGVYCGRLSARVRDELWDRVCENVSSGRVTMVFSAPGEQHMDFRVHNTTWTPIDYDGLRLMRHPIHGQQSNPVELTVRKTTMSKAEAGLIAKAARRREAEKYRATDYTVVDIETTGLAVSEDEIIEIAAIRVRNGEKIAEFERLICIDKDLPQNIVKLTKITDDLLKNEGIQLRDALDEFLHFIGEDVLIFHNASFDVAMLQIALKRSGFPRLRNRQIDTLAMARRKAENLDNFRLETLAKHFAINVERFHRAHDDCVTTMLLYQKLKEM